MPELLPSNFDDFLERFQTFYDGLVRNINLSFTHQSDKRPRHVPRGATVLISVQDQTSTENDGWVNVLLDIQMVSEFTLKESEKFTSVVLSRGLSIGFFDGKIYLAVDTEAETLDDFRGSDFLIAGGSCTWTVFPYSEDNQ